MRWLLVPVSAAFGCWFGLATGILRGSLSHSLCPADQLVSGFCRAPWIGAALGAAIAVLLPLATAPGHKRLAAAFAFLPGASYAIYWALRFPNDWQYTACAMAAGLAALAWTWHTKVFAN